MPENPPRTFYEAMQFLWFVQVGGILSENPLSLNPGRFGQYMGPYYEKDVQAGILQPDFAQELADALWLKYSKWVWTISANTAGYCTAFAGLYSTSIDIFPAHCNRISAGFPAFGYSKKSRALSNGSARLYLLTMLQISLPSGLSWRPSGPS